MDTAHVDAVLQFALAAAAQEDEPRGHELGPIHLIKYAYLADLAHAEAHEGQTFTAVPWRFYHFGPWAVEVSDRIDRAMEGVGAERRTFESAKYEGEFVRYSVVDDALYERLLQQLPVEVTRAVKQAVHEFGNDTPGLLHYVYLTPPMLKAAPGDLLFEGPDQVLSVFGFAAEASSMLAERSLPLRRALADQDSVVRHLPPPAPADPSPRPSWKVRRERKQAVAKLREEIRRRLEDRLARRRIPVRPPRYDQVYFDGVRWLDEQAGGPIEPFDGEAEFSPDIWKSPGRSDPDVP